MTRRLAATPDHVAVAVPDLDRAAAWWRDQLGGGTVSRFDNPTFSGRQLRFGNGAKLELLGPPAGGGGFVADFLDRFGTRIHHVTLKVDDLHAAIVTLEAGGLEVVDVRDDLDHWKEGFLRPSQVGGLVVQIAATPWSDEDWAAAREQRQEAPADDAVPLLGPTLGHPDPDRAAATWSLLGGEVTAAPDGLEVKWPDAPLDVRIEPAGSAGPIALRLGRADGARVGSTLAAPRRSGIHPPLRDG